MRSSRFVFLLVLLTFAKSALAQQVTAPSPQATALLQQALIALGGGHPLTDVTLSGTARRIAGSDDESGTAVLKALAAGASRMDLTLPGGNRSEVLNTSSTEPAGAWSGPDGVSHAIAFHNLLTGPAWFFPAFPISSGLSAGYLATYIGHETRNGQPVEHLMRQPLPLLQALSPSNTCPKSISSWTPPRFFRQPSLSTFIPTTTPCSTSLSRSAFPTTPSSTASKCRSISKNSSITASLSTFNSTPPSSTPASRRPHLL